MFENKTSSKWYAIFVKTGDEEKVKERIQFRLKNKDLRIIVPKRKLRERKEGKWEIKIRSLFPGYILINGQFGIDEYYALNNVPGLLKILRDKSGPTEIDENEIKVISRLMCNNEVIESSNILVNNGRIIVIDGPLLGLDGLIESYDHRKGRVKVRLNFIGEARVINLDAKMVQSA